MATFGDELKQNLGRMTPIMKKDVQQLADIQARVALQGIGRPFESDTKPGTGIASVVDKAMAIQDIYDRQEACNMFFIILGDLAKTMREQRNTYDGDKIEFGFNHRALTPEIKSLFHTWGFQPTSYGYLYYFTPPTKWDVKIPVEIHVFQKDYSFFSNPDIGFFSVDEYKLPNPFTEYWKVRGLIK